MKVLITGASGRFAQYMVAALRDDYELVLSSRKPLPEDRADLPWVQGDLNDPDDCRRMVAGVDVIQHLGAVPSPSDHPALRARRQEAGEELPPLDATLHTNIMGTYYLLQAALQEGVQTFIQTGSNCAFGAGYRISERPFPIHYLPLDEKHPSDVEDSYSYSKLAGEELLASYTRAYGLRTYVTRPSGIRPPEDLRNMKANTRPCTGWSEWMFAYVPSVDLARMQRLIMERADELEPHEVFVANAEDTSRLEPTQEVIERFRPDLLPLAGDLIGHQALFSSAKAQRLLGWRQTVGWRE